MKQFQIKEFEIREISFVSVPPDIDTVWSPALPRDPLADTAEFLDEILADKNREDWLPLL